MGAVIERCRCEAGQRDVRDSAAGRPEVVLIVIEESHSLFAHQPLDLVQVRHLQMFLVSK